MVKKILVFIGLLLCASTIFLAWAFRPIAYILIIVLIIALIIGLWEFAKALTEDD